MAIPKSLTCAVAIVFFVAWSQFADCIEAPVPQCPLISPPSAFFPAITYKSSPVSAGVSAALQSIVESFIADNPAFLQYAVSVVHEDQMVFTSGLATTPFLIGSITKTFTALGALILRERDLLSLDDPVKKFLPNFSIINPYEKHDITLRELMAHASGLPRELCFSFTVEFTDEEECPVEESDVLLALAKMELIGPPWSREPAYSNLGFALLGHSWEKVTIPPMSWNQFVMEEIVKPLGLNSTGVDLTNVTLAGFPANSSVATKKEFYAGWIGPAGQMYSTVIDLAKYLTFLLNASPPLVSSASIREWTRSSTVFPDRQSGFALPWELLLVNSTSEFIITKGGALGNYLSFVAVHPPTQLGVSILLTYNESVPLLQGPSNLGSQLLNTLIPIVEAANEEIIYSLYDGFYVCTPTPSIFSQSINESVQVVGGYFNITSTPSLGLFAHYNLSLILQKESSRPSRPERYSAISLPLLLKNATENSFWVGDGRSCLDIFESLSARPSIYTPNYPGSDYELEIAFDLEKKTVLWPALGAVCVKQ